ncbi:MAG TPA: toprim domain-containing protein [Myxococcota bacterium]|nr:toprim domain-containing protein [Myxococcota bacterium]
MEESKSKLVSVQREQLARRFPFFNEGRCTDMFHVEQPENGLHEGYPAVRLANDVWWYPVRDARPIRPDGEPMKTRAPAGRRPLLGGLDSEHVTLVEGEGDLVACMSVGRSNTVCAGGTLYLLSDEPEPTAERERLAGKDVCILFDGDKPGRDAALDLAEKLLRMNPRPRSVSVACLPDGEDPDSLLARFPSADDAAHELRGIVQGADKKTLAKLKKERQALQDSRVPALSERIRIPGSPLRIIVCTVCNGDDDPKLAVFAPASLLDGEDQDGEAFYKQKAAPRVNVDGPWKWLVSDEWTHGGITYVPDAPDLKLTLPAPPSPIEPDDAAVFEAVKGHLKRWVLLPREEHYDLLASYVLFTWRCEDVRFEHSPLMRFTGDSGSGKSRALKALRSVCYLGLSTGATASNVHHVRQLFGDATHFWDEMHVRKGRSAESAEELIKTFCEGTDRDGQVVRVFDGKLRTFNVFGRCALGGYEADEDEALARRSIVIKMVKREDQELPDDMDSPQLLPKFYAEAEAVRAQLLAWRGAKLLQAVPDPSGPRAKELRRRGCRTINQAWWPIVMMPSEALPDALESIYRLAVERKESLQLVRGRNLVAAMLQALVRIVQDGGALDTRDGTALVVRTESIVELMRDPRVNVTNVPERLGPDGAGLNHSSKFRVKGGRKVGGFKVALSCPDTAAVMARHGIEWPPTHDDKDGRAPNAGEKSPL